MMENLYTTKMSGDKKKLYSRFLKIRTKNGVFSKLMGFIIFSVILISVICISVVIAVNTFNYNMTEKDFSEYINQPIGAIMAEIDYADSEKLVFHYLNGFFVVDMENSDVKYKIDLNKLNIAPHQQGSSGLEVKIDSEGKYAYLSSYGVEEEIKDFDNYIINLDSGEVKKGAMPENTVLFDRYAQTFETIPNASGWFSNTCILSNNITYYLTVNEAYVNAIQLVSVHRDGLTGYGYVFPDNYVSISQKKVNMINEVLKKDKEILLNSGLEWGIDGEQLNELKKLIPKKIASPLKKVKGGAFNVRTYQIQSGDTSSPYIFIFDSGELKLLAYGDLETTEKHMEITRILNKPTGILYEKTYEYLKTEFYKTYTPYYDIQNLTISNWYENGNEATFFFKMEYLYYNRDPDKADYIKEAKEKNHKQYKSLYDDYLTLKESNFEFKVILKGDSLELYSNVSPKGGEWQPVKIGDYIVKRE